MSRMNLYYQIVSAVNHVNKRSYELLNLKLTWIILCPEIRENLR